jgi:hypothetical protein
MNALRHGLLSREVVLPSEDSAEFLGFARRMLRVLAPSGELQLLLADRVVSAAWRLRRIIVIESRALHSGCSNLLGEDIGVGASYVSYAQDGDAISKLGRYEAMLERSLYRALHELQRIQAIERGQPGALPLAIDVDVAPSAN